MTTDGGDVIGGVDTHGHTHHAAAISAVSGKLLGDKESPATADGYRQLLSWLLSFGSVVKVGVEGTGSYGAGLFRYLHAEQTGRRSEPTNLPRSGHDRMAEHYVHLSQSDLEDVLQQVWVAGPGAANPGEPLVGGGPMTRERAQALAIDLSRRSTPARAGSAPSNPSSTAAPAPGTWTATTATSSSSPARTSFTGGANASNGDNWPREPRTTPPPTTCTATSTPPPAPIDGLQKALAGLGLFQMSTSSDGGRTWAAPTTGPDRPCVIGGQPVVQPSGTVIVPIDDCFEGSLISIRSTDGGKTWGRVHFAAQILSSAVAGQLRTSPLPLAEIDENGKVYVVWQDCRFEAPNCAVNDIVMTTSTDGVHWSVVQRIPTNPLGSGVDHFIPGLAVDKTTGGTTARLALTYYYPQANCTPATCQLDVGFVSSINGGKSWSAKQQLAGPMNVSWLASTTQGFMVGDYISTSIPNAERDAAPRLRDRYRAHRDTFQRGDVH
jgi:hypothetical protein